MLSAAADMQLLFAAELVAGKRSGLLLGEYSAADALTRLLDGTGLHFDHTRSGVILIVPRAKPAPVIEPAARQSAGAEAALQSSVVQPAYLAPQPIEIAEVEVTSTRIAPPQLHTMHAKEMEAQGATNVLQVLNHAPAFKATTTPTTNGVRAATPGASYADLRGLGSSRTLVLVDGKRFVPQIATSLASYQVDLNQIPALLVERIETSVGGPSAEWRSGALAGVVNIILRKDFEGLRTDLQTGGSDHGDDREYRVGVLGGMPLFEGRGHVEAAIDFVRNDGTGDVYTRPWGRAGYQLAGNPCSVLASAEQLLAHGCAQGSNGLPQTLILPDVRFGNMAPGGLILDTPLRGTQFAPGGVPVPFEFGELANAGATMQGGDAANRHNNINTGISMANYVRRLGTYGRFSYDFNDALSGYFEGSYARSSGGGQTLPSRDAGHLFSTIHIDNAFLPSPIHDLMVAHDIDSFRMGRVNRDIGYQQMRQDNHTTRGVAGFEGRFGDRWSWEASLVYGVNHYYLHDAPNRIVDHYRWAVDAVRHPDTGDVVCRKSLYDPASDCVPLNVFGEGSPSAAAIAYVTNSTWQETKYEQRAAAFKLDGVPFDTWAGTIALTTGVEYRAERQVSNVDPIAAAQRYEATNSRPLRGSFEVAEAYLHAAVPVFAAARWPEPLTLHGALRVTDYSTPAGTQWPWKLGLTYQPLAALTLRAALSRDVRAPNIFELHSSPLSTTMNIAYQGLMIQVLQDGNGNPNLRPETGTTFTFGASIRPSLLPGFQLSVDYFDIQVENLIGQRNLQQMANYCADGTAAQRDFYCSLMTFAESPSGSVPMRADATYENLNKSVRTGVDLAASYRSRVGAGTWALSLDANVVTRYQTGMGTGLIERAGDLLGSPKLRGTISLSYERRPWSLTAFARHVGDMRYDNTYVEGLHINENDVPAMTYVDFSARYDLNEKLQWFGFIRNAFDTSPPYVPTAFGYPTNSVFYDMIGRTYRVGLRYQFAP